MATARAPISELLRLSQQLTLRFDPGQHRTRADFQVGAANRAAVELIDSGRDWPSRVCVLIGPEASGKSHLAEILEAEQGALILHNRPDPAIDRPAAIDWHGIAAENALAQPDRLVIVEDTGPGLDEAGLFHLINSVVNGEGRLLLTARTPPTDWRLSLPDLVSRLRAATPVVIAPPDDALLEQILAKHFGDRQMVVDPAVIRYAIARMERSYASAQALAAKLDAAALARKSAITKALAADILGAGAQPLLPGLDGDTDADAGDGQVDLDP